MDGIQKNEIINFGSSLLENYGIAINDFSTDFLKVTDTEYRLLLKHLFSGKRIILALQITDGALTDFKVEFLK
jgi:hypothetical protein